MKRNWEFSQFMIYLACVFSYVNADNLIGGQEDVSDEILTTGLYTIEGKVYAPEMPLQMNTMGAGANVANKWQTETQLSINGDEYKGFLREDGSFVISGVPYGSYVLEIINPDYYYEPVRVEINPKGKFRARKVNYVQPSQVVQVPYPLKLKALTRFKYFQQREQWKITDFLFSPMVLMMVLPLLLIVLLPKIINDPETKKEMENISFPKMPNEMPEISEVITSLFSGKQPEKLTADRERKMLNSKNNKKRT